MLTPALDFASCPADLAVLFAPGGTDGTLAAMRDADTLAFLVPSSSDPVFTNPFFGEYASTLEAAARDRGYALYTTATSFRPDEVLARFREFAARQIDGVRSVTQRAVHRRVPSPGPIAFGRGIEITLECDDTAFEGHGAFLLGAVLEQFFARYVSLNSFTETVLRSTRRGEVMRWPTRLGRRYAC